ncbi:hypothetical protein DFH29DRAFT_882755 [Suillus ampliporus]|nr:hypothetical protein DFH29DRAFT_882755 [Suillus ampliporus]
MYPTRLAGSFALYYLVPSETHHYGVGSWVDPFKLYSTSEPIPGTLTPTSHPDTPAEHRSPLSTSPSKLHQPYSPVTGPSAFLCLSGSFVYCGKKAALTVEGTIVCNVEEEVDNCGALARTSGNSVTVIGHSPEDNKTRIRQPSGAKKTVAGGGRIDKPLLKAGRAYHKYKTKRNRCIEYEHVFDSSKLYFEDDCWYKVNPARRLRFKLTKGRRGRWSIEKYRAAFDRE